MSIFDVTDNGADASGAADSTQAVMDTLTKARRAGGGDVYFPRGTYLIDRGGGSLLLRGDNITVRGEGNESVLRVSDSNYCFATYESPEDAVVQDLKIVNGGGTLGAVLVSNGTATIRRCTFEGFGPDVAIATDDIVCEKCVHRSKDGTANGQAYLINGGDRSIIRDATIEWVRQAIAINDGNDTLISDCSIDLHWWDRPEIWESSIESVASDGLVDSSKDWSPEDIGEDTHTIRVLVPRFTCDASSDGTLLALDGSTCKPSVVQVGDWVEYDDAVGLVAEVNPSNSTLRVEAWRDGKRRSKSVTGSDQVTVSRIVLGRVWGLNDPDNPNVSDGVNIWRWYDLEGNTVEPQEIEGERYQLVKQAKKHGVDAVRGTSGTTIVNCAIKRGYGDVVALWGTRQTVVGCTIERGQDVGITLHGSDNLIVDNVLKWHGSSGIWLNDTFDSIITGNEIANSTWVNHVNKRQLADITLLQGDRNRISANSLVHNPDKPLGGFGITLANIGGDACRGNVIVGNEYSDHTENIHIATRNLLPTESDLKQFVKRSNYLEQT